ncbi:uncharacterized protein N7483_008374 [Penicillium malachiteum]|uniref:uncharacterized protein n=1 Tax=Penicillium malachiteum TaxID=1324776 RepID=UPI0025479709|nr:uncharacterized protein N7483_008374 [Penicillium malachiteum]KAJ5720440.1 hypothetical protein N7483_008374 [Penicillium malachiteum]
MEGRGQMHLDVSSFTMRPPNLLGQPSRKQSGSEASRLTQHPAGPSIDLNSFSFAKRVHRQQAFASRNPAKQTPLNPDTGGSFSRAAQKVPMRDDDPSFTQASALEPSVELDSQLPETRISCKLMPSLPEKVSLTTSASSHAEPSHLETQLMDRTLSQSPQPVEEHNSEPSKPRNETISTVCSSQNDEGVPISSRPGSSESIQAQDQMTDAGKPTHPGLLNLPRLKLDGQSSARSTQVRKSKPLRRQNANSMRPGPQNLTEDKLFELLIGRMRQREESEAAAACMQREIEAQNVQLTKQNQELQQKVQFFNKRLHESDAECQANRSLLGEWKAKIRNFKQVVNELGHGYDSLGDEAQKLKDTVISLEKEKSDLTEVVNQIKMRIAQAEGTIEVQQNNRHESEKQIMMLEQYLHGSKKREEVAQKQLTDQKTRIATLESYIQNCASVQARQLGLIKEGQQGLLEKLTARITTMTDDSVNAKDTLLLAIKSGFEDWHSSMQSLAEKSSAEQANVARFTQKAQDIVSQIDTLATQFTQNIEGSIRINNGVSKTLQKRFQEIQHHLGSESPMMKRLDHCDAAYEALKNKLDVIQPALGTLSNSVHTFTSTENMLVHDLESLSKKLEEVQIPAGNPALELEVAKKFTENTELQVKVHERNSKIETLNECLSSNKTLIEDLQQSLSAAAEKQHETENQNKRLSTEKTKMQLEMESSEQRIRQELDKQSHESLNRMKMEHEAHLRVLQNEKNDVERSAGELVTQLQSIQKSLVEAKELVNKHSHEREVSLQGKEKRIGELEKSCTDALTQLTIQTEEIQKFQELDATSRVENSDLRDRLEHAQQKIHDLEQKLTETGTETENAAVSRTAGIVPFAAIQNQLLSRPNTPLYGESCDFTMLFMSDELAPSTPLHTFTNPKASLKSVENFVDETSNKPRALKNKDTAVAGSEKLSQSSKGKKRKAVNFETAKTGRQAKKPTKTQPSGSQAQASGNLAQPASSKMEESQEGRPAKLSKQVQKWTYSRVRSSATQIQQEETRVPFHALAAGRRPSPQGLISANTSEVVTRPKAQSRSRRRTRSEKYDARFKNE